MNRLLVAINKMDSKLESLDKEAIEKLEKSMDDITESDLRSYQNIQSISFMKGTINIDEAHLLYNILGRDYPTVEKFKNRKLSERICMNQIIMELIKRGNY